MHTQNDFDSDAISSLNLSHFVPTIKDADDMKDAYLSLLGRFFTRVVDHCDIPNNHELRSVRYPLRELFQIDTADIPTVLPLPTYDLNEGVVNEVIKILDKIQDDVRLPEKARINGLVMLEGDFMTVRNARYTPCASFY